MPPRKTMTHTFTLVLKGPNPNDSANLDRLFEFGCDDATFGERDSVYIADFDREAPTFSEALTSAITAVESAVPGLRVVRVEPEELVTASEIATRTKRSRESIRQLFEGMRGEGDFPRPTAWLSDRTRLWHWSEVSRWFATRLHEEVDSAEDAELLGVANAVLTLRRFIGRLTEEASPDPEATNSLLKSWSNLGDWLTESSRSGNIADLRFAEYLLQFFNCARQESKDKIPR
jgi:hypothetical protein